MREMRITGSYPQHRSGFLPDRPESRNLHPPDVYSNALHSHPKRSIFVLPPLACLCRGQDECVEVSVTLNDVGQGQHSDRSHPSAATTQNRRCFPRAERNPEQPPKTLFAVVSRRREEQLIRFAPSACWSPIAQKFRACLPARFGIPASMASPTVNRGTPSMHLAYLESSPNLAATAPRADLQRS